MNVDQERAVLDFVDAGVACHEQGVLPDALAELAVRLEIAGAGDLLDQLVAQQGARRRGRWARGRRP